MKNLLTIHASITPLSILAVLLTSIMVQTAHAELLYTRSSLNGQTSQITALYPENKVSFSPERTICYGTHRGLRCRNSHNTMIVAAHKQLPQNVAKKHCARSARGERCTISSRFNLTTDIFANQPLYSKTKCTYSSRGTGCRLAFYFTNRITKNSRKVLAAL